MFVEPPFLSSAYLTPFLLLSKNLFAGSTNSKSFFLYLSNSDLLNFVLPPVTLVIISSLCAAGLVLIVVPFFPI